MTLLDILKFKGGFVTQPLREQHRETVIIIYDFIDAETPYDEYIANLTHILNKHFVIEEEILFPAFKPILDNFMANEEPIRLLTGEHRAIKHIFEYLVKSKTIDTKDDNIKKIDDLLLHHIFKEENGIFNMIDNYMPDDIKKEVSDKIKSFTDCADKDQ